MNTPGPLEFEDGAIQTVAKREDGLPIFRDFWQFRVPCESTPSEQYRLLFLAAPDLLAACQAVLPVVVAAIYLRPSLEGRTRSESEAAIKSHDLVKMLRTAIAKATGEETEKG